MAARRLAEKIRQRLDREIGTVYKPHAGRLTFALAFPNSYYLGMSNLGFQTVYRLLNDRDDVVCERVFLPDPPDLEEVRPGTLTTMESQTPVSGFDVLAFSASFELDYPNILRILALSGIGGIADERDSGPLIIAGGPAATFNPEALAPFIDVFVIGEAEETLPELVDVLNKGHEDRLSLLEELARIPGVYVPRFCQPEYNEDGTIKRVIVSHGAPEKVRRRWMPALDPSGPALEPYAPVSAILTPETEFSNMILAEVARGCGRQCRFCVAGYAYLPPRAREAEAVLGGVRRMEGKAAEKGLAHPRIGLLSASVFDHPSSALICRELVERDRLFSISSTRADTLTADIAQLLHRGGHETLTIAPEAGTERLRMAINKTMTDDDIMNAAAIAWDGGFRRLKLYFLVGLPTETPEDVAAIPTIVSEIAGRFNWERLTISLGCFVPKPWTPFQWAPMEREKELADKLKGIRQALRPLRKVEVAGESAREAVVQGVLARGDRRLRDALIAHSSGNTSWRGAFRQAGVLPEFYAQRTRHKDEIFPWDHLDLGVRKAYLWEEYGRAMNAASTPACIVGKCRRCGVCHR